MISDYVRLGNVFTDKNQKFDECGIMMLNEFFDKSGQNIIE